jgi:acyl-CoA hydrolase
VVVSYLLLASLSQAYLTFGKETQNQNLIIISADAIDPMESSLNLGVLQIAQQIAPDQIRQVFPVIFRHMDIEDHVMQVRAVPLEDMQQYNDMITFTPVIENPKLVAEETVNNILTDHFTFKVSGLGVKSGAEVTTNQGDYWLAKDGSYVVKYSLVTETRGGPNSEIIHLEVHIELTDINQPVTIALPAQCVKDKNAKVTPTP